MVPALPIILFFCPSTLPAVPCRAAVLLVIVVRSLVVECVGERVVFSSLLSPCHLTVVIVGMFVEKAKNYRNHEPPHLTVVIEIVTKGMERERDTGSFGLSQLYTYCCEWGEMGRKEA